MGKTFTTATVTLDGSTKTYASHPNDDTKLYLYRPASEASTAQVAVTDAISTDDYSIKWYSDSAGTADETATAPTGITLTKTSTSKLTASVDATATEGTYYFKLTATDPLEAPNKTATSDVVVLVVQPMQISFVSLAANGTANTSDTTELTVILGKPIELTEDNIIVLDATMGTLTGSGTSYTLSISDITVAEGQTVTVILSKTGYDFSPSYKNVAIHKAVIPVEYQSLTANGSANETETTELEITFDTAVTLTETDITVYGATKGDLTGAGTSYTLTISDITVAEGEDVTVELSKIGYAFTPTRKSVAIHRVPMPVEFLSLTANGNANETETTELEITFDTAITLAATDITVYGATKGNLTGSGTSYTLTISDITAAEGEDVTVELSKTGYAFTPASKTAAIHKAPVTHAITVTVGEGGTISPRGTILVNHGDSKTFTISPNKNYLIESVTIDGINQGKITTYTFTDIVENHSISATFKYNDNATTEEGSKPAPTEPMPTEPAPTKPAPTEPTLTEPTPT